MSIPAVVIASLKDDIIVERVLHQLQEEDVLCGVEVPDEELGMHLKTIHAIEDFLIDNGGLF